MSPKTGVQVSKCTCKKAIFKPKPSGKQITEATFLQQLYEYEHAKETRTGTIVTNPKSPHPSTSGIHNKSIETALSDNDMSDEDSVVCCVCKSFYPPSEKILILKLLIGPIAINAVIVCIYLFVTRNES
ncbi:hypothetical protein DPMN_072755 [Dreissena polymorpha]|uniref:Uncharacterized protein n=1 Tax=Dreissena polymorpha TaxID=45954 RepID=A0A9D4HC66_DREPO|nr:hypothetical protein DPMN_072755 [Dreissena polymorpha]